MNGIVGHKKLFFSLIILLFLICMLSSGIILTSSTLQTALKPESIKITADTTLLKANSQELSYVTVEMVDHNGLTNKVTEKTILFELSGPGEIIGVSSSDPRNIVSFLQPFHKSFRGRCMLIVKSGTEPGEVILKASAKDLKPAELKIYVR